MISAGRFGQPAEVAAAVAFFCSESAAFITGQTLFIDGGASIGRSPTRTKMAIVLIAGSLVTKSAGGQPNEAQLPPAARATSVHSAQTFNRCS